jgi:hypothetical protein
MQALDKPQQHPPLSSPPPPPPPPTLNVIDPQAKSQTWDLVPAATPAADIVYSALNHVSRGPLYSGQWRLLYIPAADQDPALTLPSPTPVLPSQFLLMDMGSLSLLGLDAHQQLVLQKASDIGFPSEGLDGVSPPWGNPIVGHMVGNLGEFRKSHALLIWRLYPEGWAPENGIPSPERHSYHQRPNANSR